MGSYASGKYALGLCDRGGFQYSLNALKKEWTGFKVCFECYEPKHPQLEPRRTVNDPIALFEPRPDQPQAMVVSAWVPNDTSFTAVGMVPTVPALPLIVVGEVGTVEVIIT